MLRDGALLCLGLNWRPLLSSASTFFFNALDSVVANTCLSLVVCCSFLGLPAWSLLAFAAVVSLAVVAFTIRITNMATSSGRLLSLIVLLRSAVCDPPFPPSGAAAWVYDAAGGEPAEWALDLGGYNARAKRPVDTIFSYGGDMEWYPGSPNPYQTYFPPASQQAAAAYAATPGVRFVICVVDGRMDGGASYDPDLSKLTDGELREWASNTAALYCSVDSVDVRQRAASGVPLARSPRCPPPPLLAARWLASAGTPARSGAVLGQIQGALSSFLVLPLGRPSLQRARLRQPSPPSRALYNNVHVRL